MGRRCFDVSADGRYIAYVMNEDGRSRLTVIDNQMKLELTPPGVPDGRISEPALRPQRPSASRSPPNPRSRRAMRTCTTSSKSALERWTRSEAGPVDTNTFVPPELVHYPTWDRVDGKPRTLSAYVYRPKHAGPASGAHQHPRRAGIAVPAGLRALPAVPGERARLSRSIAPNVRGSSGYGKTFLKLDNGVLREDSVKDIGSLLVWIGVQPVLRSRAHRRHAAAPTAAT